MAFHQSPSLFVGDTQLLDENSSNTATSKVFTCMNPYTLPGFPLISGNKIPWLFTDQNENFLTQIGRWEKHDTDTYYPSFFYENMHVENIKNAQIVFQSIP